MLLDSPKFWKAFAEEYKQDGELLSDEAISDFKRNTAHDLSDVYAEIQEIREFWKVWREVVVLPDIAFLQKSRIIWQPV